MKRKLVLAIIGIVGVCVLSGGLYIVIGLLKPQEQKMINEATVIESFYRDYLEQREENSKSFNLKFSNSFNQLVAEDLKLCAEKADTDICGWGADSDIYLDSQEVDPDINFESAHFILTNPQKGVVNVEFNVFPSIEDKDHSYQKQIQFQMIEETGEWVVDDIIYEGKRSARKQIKDEIDFYSK